MNKYKEAYDFILTATNGGEGMVKEMNIIRELVEKATPKKPIDIQCPVVIWGLCPTCMGELNPFCGMPNRVFRSDRYCRDCGQALDWSEEDE